MVTVTGPGGVGKTRLTTHTVERVAQERPDGGWFVDLSQVADPRAVVPAVAAAVGVVEPPGRSVDDALSAVLAGPTACWCSTTASTCWRRWSGASAGSSRDCPRLTVVATSRARLGASYEWVYELPGLERRRRGLAVPRARRGRRRRRTRGAQGRRAVRAARGHGAGDRARGGALPVAGARRTDGGAGRPAAAARLRRAGRGSGRCAPPSPGASTCSTTTSARCSRPARCSPRGSRSAARDGRLAGPHRRRRGAGAGHARRPAPAPGARSATPRRTASRRSSGSTPPSCSATGRGGGAAARAWAANELTSLTSVEHDDAWCEAFDRLAVEVRAALGTAPTAGARRAVRRGAGAARSARGGTAPVRDRSRRPTAPTACGCCGWPPERRRPAWSATRRCGCSTRRAAALPRGPGGRRRRPRLVGDLRRPARPGSWPTRRRPTSPRRLAEARRRAPAGSSAEATVAAARPRAWPTTTPRPRPRACARPSRRSPRDCRSLPRPPSTASARATSCAGSTPTPSRRSGSRGGPGPTPARRHDGVRLQRLPADGLRGLAGRRRPPRCRAVRRPAGRAAVLPRLRAPGPGPPPRGRRPGRRPGRCDRARRALPRRRGSRPAGTGRRRSRSAPTRSRSRTGCWATTPSARSGDDRRAPGRRPAGRRDGVETGWAPTLDAWLLLDRGDRTRRWPSSPPTWTTPCGAHGTTALWRPWYAAAWAEAAALAGVPDLDGAAGRSGRRDPRQPRGRRPGPPRRGPRAPATSRAVAALAPTFDELGADYQRDRSRRLAQ